MIRKLLPGLLLFVLVFSSASAQTKSYDADRFDADVWVQPDGSLFVQESVNFRFQGGPFSYVFRQIPTDHTDGIVEIVAGSDGVIWPEGTGPNQIEIESGNPIGVVWHLSPTSNASKSFNLSYRPLGVVRQGDDVEVLDWQALPDEYDYAIQNSRVTFDLPPAAALLKPPEILAGAATVETGEGRVTFSMDNLQPGDPLVVRLTFPPGTFTGVPPGWQAQQQAQNSRAWIWIISAIGILTGGLGAVFAFSRPRYRTSPKSGALASKPPIELSPALAGYLFNTQVSWQHGLATLFDLARRGLLEIEEISEKKWYSRPDFNVTLLSRSADLQPHEQALVDLLFTDKKGVAHDVITMSEMGRLITSSRWMNFRDNLKDEADRAGLVDQDSRLRGRRLTITGVILMLAASLLFIMIVFVNAIFGFWPMLTAGAIFIVGIIATIAGATINPLSQRGAQLASAFEPYKNWLRAVSKGNAEVPDPAYFEAYLPYAAAFGIAEAWVKQQSKAGYEAVPAYFRSMNESSGSEMVVFIAAVSAASNSGGAAGAGAAGAAGASAAGGGASGAG